MRPVTSVLPDTLKLNTEVFELLPLGGGLHDVEDVYG